MEIDDYFDEMLTLMPLLTRTSNIEGVNRIGLCIDYAQAGFRLSNPPFKWTLEHKKMMITRLNNDLSEDNMKWFEECSLAVSCFSSFVLGNLLWKFIFHDWDDNTFMLYDARLAGFNFTNDEKICLKFIPR